MQLVRPGTLWKGRSDDVQCWRGVHHNIVPIYIVLTFIEVLLAWLIAPWSVFSCFYYRVARHSASCGHDGAQCSRVSWFDCEKNHWSFCELRNPFTLACSYIEAVSHFGSYHIWIKSCAKLFSDSGHVQTTFVSVLQLHWSKASEWGVRSQALWCTCLEAIAHLSARIPWTGQDILWRWPPSPNWNAREWLKEKKGVGYRCETVVSRQIKRWKNHCGGWSVLNFHVIGKEKVSTLIKCFGEVYHKRQMVEGQVWKSRQSHSLGDKPHLD